MDTNFIVFALLLGLLALVSLIISGLIFITEPLFQNNNVVLSNPNLGISKMAIIMTWLSLPITVFMIGKNISKIVKNMFSIIIIILGVLVFIAFLLYGLSIISVELFTHDGIYIKEYLEPATPTESPPPSLPTLPANIPGVPALPPNYQCLIWPSLCPQVKKRPHIYVDTLTQNCIKMATIFSWISVGWNIYFLIVKSSGF